MTTTSYLVNEDLLVTQALLARTWALAAFNERGRDPRLIRALSESRHLTRASRVRLAKFFYFGSDDGTVDEVM